MSSPPDDRALALSALAMLRVPVGGELALPELLQRLRDATRFTGSTSEEKLANLVGKFLAEIEHGRPERAAALLPRIERTAEFAFDWD